MWIRRPRGAGAAYWGHGSRQRALLAANAPSQPSNDTRLVGLPSLQQGASSRRWPFAARHIIPY